MRYVYVTLISSFALAVLIFAMQNGRNVTISFLSMSVTLPLALLVISTYLSGIFTGGFVLALLRNWIHGARRA